MNEQLKRHIEHFYDYAMKEYKLDREVIENLESFVPDNLIDYEEGTAEHDAMYMSTLWANLETLVNGDWFPSVYAMPSAKKYKIR